MSLKASPLPLLLSAFLLGSAACTKPPAKGSESGPPIPEFTKTDAASWVNGPPFRFADARGSVVLVEAWHPL